MFLVWKICDESCRAYQQYTSRAFSEVLWFYQGETMLEIINERNMNFLFEIAKKPRNISELAKRGDLTVSNASTLITRLERENVLEKTTSDGERGREIIITLTEYGEAQVKLLRELRRNYKKNKEEINNILDKIITEKGGEK